jgi:hypothetical protein
MLTGSGLAFLMLFEWGIDALASAWHAAHGLVGAGDSDLACALDCRYSYVTLIDKKG